MERAIAHFKRSHPTRIEKLRVIVVDKDLNEIRVLEEHFPDARVIICHFHVIKYLKEKRAKPEFGKISSEDSSHIDAAIHKMVYAHSEEEYNDAKDSLCGICSRVGMEGFYEYFLKNWDTSQERWVSYLRSKLPHFKNHTNNRLESFFGKLKDSVDGSMSMAMCIKAIVAYDRRMQNEYEYRLSRIGRFVNSNYDEEMTNVLRFTTHYVAQQIEQQYSTAMAKFDTYKYSEDSEVDGDIFVSGKFSEHRLRISDWICDCEFSLSMRLPCRHAIAYRKHVGVTGPLIPWGSIDESEMADIQDDDEFEEMLKFVLTQWRNVRQRKMEEVLAGKSTAPDAKSVCEQDELEDAARLEFDLSSSDNEDQPDASPVTIRLNPKAKKVGAPRKMKKNTVAGEKEGRQWFEAAESGRKLAGADTLMDLLDVLARDKPGLLEAQRRLSGVITVFVPLNFGNMHWCCVVVKVAAKRLFYYNPLNQAPYMNAAKEVAVSLKIAGLNEFDVIPMNNPIQFDGFSCGVFVCWMFIRQINCVPPQDMSDSSLPRRRFELLCYLLTGRLLPAEAALLEEKAPVPGTPGDEVDEEDVAPTQVADK
eukprot:jgi/Phyca11/121307/e_gw1.43.209.1